MGFLVDLSGRTCLSCATLSTTPLRPGRLLPSSLWTRKRHSTALTGPSFISWVNLLYFHVQSSVNVNGYLSPFFPLSRGVRQGCPLSPLLYVLVSEVLAVNIRRNPRISGLSLPGFPPLSPISQYADDTSLVLTSDESIRAVFETFAQFEAASGAKLNRSKSKGLWLGAWSGCSNPL